MKIKGNIKEGNKADQVDPDNPGKESNFFIPIIIEGWKGKAIKKYRIDKITGINKESKGRGQTLWQKILAKFKKREKEGESACDIETPGKTPGPEADIHADDKKTTKISTPIEGTTSWPLECQGMVKEEFIDKYNKFKVDLTLINENNGEIKREIDLELKKKKNEVIYHAGEPKKIGEYKWIVPNLFLFIAALLGLLIWNTVLNNEIYNQYWFTKKMWVNLLLGGLTGYFGMSIWNLVTACFKFKSVGNFCSFPENFLKPDLIEKLKSKISFAVLLFSSILFPSFFFLPCFQSVVLPGLPSEKFSYYDSTRDEEVNSPRIYCSDIPGIKVAFNGKISTKKTPFYFAYLETDKLDRLMPVYKEIIIENEKQQEETRFSFEEVAEGKELKGNKKYVEDWAYGKTAEEFKEDSISIKQIEETKFRVKRIKYVEIKDLKKMVAEFSDEFNLENLVIEQFDVETSLTDKDYVVDLVRKRFPNWRGKKLVKAENLVDIYKNHRSEMDTSFQNDIKELTLIWALFDASKEFKIKFTGSQLKEILNGFQSYYKSGKIKGISDINFRTTRIYFRLLLRIEKYFTDVEDDLYEEIHQSIANVLEGEKAVYYRYYLGECIKSNMLFEPGEEDGYNGLRTDFFTTKALTFGKPKRITRWLKKISLKKGVSDRSKAYLDYLIEKLAVKSDP